MGSRASFSKGPKRVRSAVASPLAPLLRSIVDILQRVSDFRRGYQMPIEQGQLSTASDVDRNEASRERPQGVPVVVRLRSAQSRSIPRTLRRQYLSLNCNASLDREP
jgi:hypothetical protein